MKEIGLIGVGRMGRVLARKLADHVHLKIFDRDEMRMKAVAQDLELETAASLEEIAELKTIVLVVPDREVISIIKDLNQIGLPINVFNVATNVAHHVLEETASKQIKSIGVKFVAHAKEMSLGAEPVIIVDERPPELAELAKDIFSPIGKIILGQADRVTYINSLAAEKALTAAVIIEETLMSEPYANQEIVNSAIRQVAAGIMKAYADDDLGPFAREIIRAVKAKLRK